MFFTISNITLSGVRRDKQIARENLAQGYNLDQVIAERNLPVHLLGSVSVSIIDRKVKMGLNLTFEEAFVGMCYVIASTNKIFLERFGKVLGQAYGVEILSHDRAIAIGAAFLNLMALKESIFGLTSEEIAGLVAAGLMDTVFSLYIPEVLETCGMGGDKGFGVNGSRTKSVNVSTLSSFVLAAAGCVVAKHGSYANSTVVGSTDSLELFGASTTPSSIGKIEDMLRGNKFSYIDAHLCKTLHDLSHLIMMETINHVIGPMTPPFSKGTALKKIMGVNEKVSPREVAKAYAQLDKLGIQKNAGVIVVAGLSKVVSGLPEDLSDRQLRDLVILDEVSPFSTFISVSVGENYVGDYIITPADFGIEITPEEIQVIGNSEIIHQSNVLAIKGEHKSLADYLAMNAALGLYLSKYEITSSGLDRDALKECFVICRETITNGKAYENLCAFVKDSNV